MAADMLAGVLLGSLLGALGVLFVPPPQEGLIVVGALLLGLLGVIHGSAHRSAGHNSAKSYRVLALQQSGFAGQRAGKPTGDVDERKSMDDVSQTKWEGRWDQLKGRARQMWGDLTDDDLDVAEGNYEEFIGRIKERTGETAEDVRARLEDDNNY